MNNNEIITTELDNTYQEIIKQLNQNTGNIENIIKRYPENIIAAHKTTGQYNTLLITRFKDTTELNIFLET